MLYLPRWMFAGRWMSRLARRGPTHGKDAMTTPAASALPLADRPRFLALLAPVLLPLICLTWAFWTTLVELAQTWNTNPQYSHGFLVPAFAAVLLWLRRDRLPTSLDNAAAGFRPRCLGAALLLAGLAMRLAGTYWYFTSAESIALLPCIAGLVLLVGGLHLWRWAWPAVLFLAFMIPLPFRVASALSGQLQWLATITSTYVMQTLGLPALAEGNVILLNEHQIGIVEACSGLRMLVVFFALSTAVVLLVQRHWIDRLLILASAVPIALASNIIRITGTGIMYDAGFSEMANHFFHDAAGWLMMPIGLSFLWLELWVLAKLFIDVPTPIPTRPRSAAPRRTAQAKKAAKAWREDRPASASSPLSASGRGAGGEELPSSALSASRRETEAGSRIPEPAAEET
jgi:exosortase